MQPNRDTPAVPATRLACDRCHDHKLRCDRSPITGEPCRRCARVKAECRYGRPRRFGRPRKRKDSSAMEDPAGSSPGSSAPSQEPTPPPRKPTHRDSGVADIDSPEFYEVGDSPPERDPMSLVSDAQFPSSTELLLSEGSLYAEPLAPNMVDDTDWLGANMAATDIDMSLFTNFDSDPFVFPEDGRLPTPPDSPDCDSPGKTTGGSCFPNANVFTQSPAPGLFFQKPERAFSQGQGIDTTDTLTQLQLRLHQISTLPQDTLLDQSNGRCTLIEETITASQTFIEILRRMSQPPPASPLSPMSSDMATSGWSSASSDANSPPSSSPFNQQSSGSSAISTSTSLLTLVCYVRVIESFKDVLLLLRRVLNPEAGGVGTSIPSLDSLSASLPQIKIGSICSPSSPRIQVALLAQLLASLLDEVRECIGQLVASSAGGGGCTSEGLVIGESRAAASPSVLDDRTSESRPAALMRLAEEGVWRDEAELKRQLLAMTQLLQ